MALLLLPVIAIGAAEYQFRHIDTTDGLPSNKINVIHRDRDGYLWLGSTASMCRYDGHNHRTYYVNDSLSNTRGEPDVVRISEDFEGRLWLRSHRQYFLYDPEADAITSHTPELLAPYGVPPAFNLIHTLGDGAIIASDPDTGFYVIRPDYRQAIHIGLDDFPSLKGEDITDLIDTPFGLLGVTRKGAIVSINLTTLKIEAIDTHIPDTAENKAPFSYCLFYDRDGLLWVYNHEHLWLYNCRQERWRDDLFEGFQHTGVSTIEQDHEGRLWIARNHFGLEMVIKSPDKLTFRRVDDGGTLPDRFTINTIHEDFDGTIWLGTYKRGLYGYNPAAKKFELVTMPDVNCITTATDGNVWVGTDAEGVFKWSPRQRTLTPLPYSDDPGESVAVTSLYGHTDGNLYVGTFSRGLRCYDGKTYRHLTTGSELDQQYIWNFAPTGDGRVWIGTLGGGLFRYNPEERKVDARYDISNSALTTLYILSSTLAPDGTACFGTSDGVFLIPEGKSEPERLAAIPHGNINDLLVDSRGLLWTATMRGLKVYDPKFRRLSNVAIPGTLDVERGSMLGVTEDRNGSIWVTEGCRLVRFRVGYDETTGDITTHAQTFDALDGLQNGDFNQRSFCVMPDGTLLVGGLNGISRVHPSELTRNAASPKVLFSDFIISNHVVAVGEKVDGRVPLKESLNTGRRVELSHNEHDLTILLASDNLILPEKNIYTYMLEGYQRTWHTTAPGENRVTFSNLAPGNYRLLVRAYNADGVVSTETAALDIIVHPPFYQTTWAKAIYLVLAIVAIYLAYHYVRLRELRKYREKRKADAMQKQEELNRAKFNFFTNVSHELRTPITLILAPLEAMIKENPESPQLNLLVLMRNNARRLLHQVNQLLDFRKNEEAGLVLNLSDGDLVGFVSDVCRSFLVFNERRNLKVEFTTTLATLPMRFDADKIYKVVMNILGNAIKFTPDGGTVNISVERTDDGRDAILRVADTGPGIPDKDKARVFERFYQSGGPSDTKPSAAGSGIGLSLVKEYIDLHEGKVEISDGDPTGCVVTVTLPVVKCEKPLDKDPFAIEPPSDSERPVVLVVDDNAEMRGFIKDYLTGDYHVTTVPGAVEALNLMQTVKPALVITDLMMTDMDGIELVKRIRSTPSLSRIPVMVLTAKHSDDSKIEALNAGADDYMTKPFDIELLRLRVERLVAGSRANSQQGLIDPEPESIAITPLDEKMVDKSIKYVMDNIHRPDLSVEELSAHLGMSRVHLYKRLKSITGKTPVEFIRTLRLKRGAQLLRESQLNVSEVAYKVGYNSPKYFSKYFKEEYGMIPSVYQEAERRGLDTSASR